MKKISVIFSALFIFLFINFFFISSLGQSYDRSNYDYWWNKMENPNQNFNELVQEFDNYCIGKETDELKSTGYKHFKRWQYAKEGMTGPDGKLLPASYFAKELEKFNQLYGSESIVGDWDFIGPDIVPIYPGSSGYGTKTGIGRIACIAFHPTDANTIYVGAHTGGIWKTTTGGDNWTNLNTDQIPSLGVSAILVHPTNPNIILIGTGDRDADHVSGQGIWKSLDGGSTWSQRISVPVDKLVSEILIRPDNYDILLAAAEDGVYISTDIGETWMKTSGIDRNVKDMVFKPGDPSVVYATGYGEFYRSSTFGLSWNQVTSGLFTTSRMVIGVTADAPEKVFIFAARASHFEGFYVSTNSGQSFTKIPTSAFDGEGFGSFCIALGVDPTNEDRIFAGMQAAYKSIDGGNTWTKISGADNVHADQHAIEFSPHTNDLYFGCDGGLYHSNYLGVNFTNISDGLEITQVTRLAVSENNPGIFMAGLQDNGTIIPFTNEFYRVLGSDGMNCAIDYTNDLFMYGSWQNSHIYRSMEGAQYSVAWPVISSSIDEDAGWFRPFILDKDNPNRMFAGYQNVWRSNNVKTANADDVSWVNISDGKLNSDIAIELIEQSLADGNIIYISKDDGSRLYRTDNAYASNPDWTEITRPYGWPVKCFETNPSDPDIVYIVIEKYIYKSTDRGVSWTSITGHLPDIPLKCLVYHIGSNDGLYVGTLAGVYYKDADMADWVLFKSGLPLVPVSDMKIIYSTTPDRLVAGTWGRGVWETDAMPIMKPNLSIPSAAASINQTEVTINLGIFNEDNFNEAENYHLGYYLSTNNIISTGDYLIGEDFIPIHPAGIVVGEDIITDVRFIQPEIPVGTYYIGAYADNQFEIDETDEANNSKTCVTQVSIPAPPGAPYNVQATDGTYGNKIVISWDEPSSPYNLYYKVYRNTVNNSGTALPLGISWIEGANFDDLTASNGQDYYYWVRASDTQLGLRPGAFSSSNTGWQYLSPPDNVDATKGQFSNKVNISWSSAEGATHYKIFQNTLPNPATSTAISGWISTTTFSDYTPVLGTTYYYWVKSAMSSGGLRESPQFSNITNGYITLADAPVAVASDGTFTDKVEITWNTVPGATHYALYRNTENDPDNSSLVMYWSTNTSFSNGTAVRGTLYYYWVKASLDQYGNITSGYGEEDTGWRNFEAPEDVQATDGSSTDFVEITWDNNIWTQYYRVYRSLNANPVVSVPVSGWIDEDPGLSTTFIDSTPSSPPDYFYWVKCANDPLGEFSSDFSSYDKGWRKLSAPDITATKGVYANKIRITWDPVPGANSYRVMRNILGQPWAVDTLTDWSGTMSYYVDYAVTLGDIYQYQVMAAYNNYGTKPSSPGFDFGFADQCGNLTDNLAFRSINFHGITLEINQRVINNGPHPILNPSKVAYVLEETPPVGSWNYFLGKATIPPLAVGAHYDISFIVELDTIIDAPVSYGTWTVASFMPIDGANCQSNPLDDYQIWDKSFEFTDALFGTYTIGGTDPDFPTFTNVVSNLINRGISDHVIFNVRPGTYYEQILLTNINGLGPDQTITFQTEPSETDNAELNYASNEGNYIIQFDGCSYITIQNLDLTSPGFTDNSSTYGRVLDFRNDAHHISIINNIITGTTDDTNISEDNAVIYCENSFCNDIFFMDNEILNGSTGIHFHGVGSGVNLSTGLQINGNTIQNFMYTGISLKYQQNPQIVRNTIQYFTSAVSQCNGIEMSDIENGFMIDKNQLIMEPNDFVCFGIYLYNCNGDVLHRGLVSNNFIAMTSAGFPLYGITYFNSNYADIYYNSINLSGTNFQDNFCINLDCSTDPVTYNNRLLNNIFSNQAGGYSILIGDNAISNNYISSSDYNDLYFTGSFIGLYGNSNQVSNLASWQASTAFDENSISADPEFVSATDLHSSSSNIDGIAMPVTEVPYDIDWEYRDWLFPDIGADEYVTPPPDLDAAVSDIISPVSGIGLGNEEPVQIEIANFGTIGLGSLVVSYTVNGGSPVTELFPDTLMPWGSYENYTFATTADLSAEGTYEIQAYCSLSGDERPSNDTITVMVENQLINPYNCIPLYGEGCIYGADINDFYFNNLSHEYTGCSQDSYGDFTGMSETISQGESYWLGFSSESDYMYLALWIDYNDDLIFSENEKVKDSLSSPYAYMANWDTLNIPAGAMPGQHRMRARAAYMENYILPCKYYEYGEAHDYTVDVQTGNGLAVYAGADVSVCNGQPATLTAVASGGTPPYSYLWSNGMTGSSIIVNVNTDTVYAVHVTDQDGYLAVDYVAISLNDSPESLPSAGSPVCEGSDIVLQGDGNAFGTVTVECQSNCSLPPGYCDSYGLDIMGTGINEVIFNTIQNNSADSCKTYSDFTAIQTSIGRSFSYNLSITSGGCYGDQYHIVSTFIDWNRDADFDDTGEMVAYFDPIFSTTIQDTIVHVPVNAVLGKTMMRVITVGDWMAVIDTVLPCGNYFNGETEDYTINIVDMAPNQITSWNWSGPGSFSSVLQNPVISNANSTNEGYYVLEVGDDKGCTETDSVYVGIQIAPSAFAGNDANIQRGESYLLSEATASDYTTLEWTTLGNGYFDNPYSLNPVYYPEPWETGITFLYLTTYGYSPCSEQSDTMELEILPPAGFAINLKVFLQGPFNGTEMRTDLNEILPNSQPYSNSPWYYLGTETTALIPNPNIVDWILIELRDAPDASTATHATTIAQQAAFLLKDGSVVELDGSSNLQFDNPITQSLFVVICHRNHVGIISANPLVRIGDVYSYDFTTDDLQVLGGGLGYKELIPGTWGMAGGDGDGNGTVESADKTTIWVPDVGTNGYKVSDFNMDTQIDNKDKNDIWFFNLGKESQIPE